MEEGLEKEGEDWGLHREGEGGGGEGAAGSGGKSTKEERTSTKGVSGAAEGEEGEGANRSIEFGAIIEAKGVVITDSWTLESEECTKG